MPLLITFTQEESLFLCRLLCNARDAEHEEDCARIWALLMGIARGGVLLLLDSDRRLLVDSIMHGQEQACVLLDEDLPEEHRAIAEGVLGKLQQAGVRT